MKKYRVRDVQLFSKKSKTLKAFILFEDHPIDPQVAADAAYRGGRGPDFRRHLLKRPLADLISIGSCAGAASVVGQPRLLVQSTIRLFHGTLESMPPKIPIVDRRAASIKKAENALAIGNRSTSDASAG